MLQGQDRALRCSCLWLAVHQILAECQSRRMGARAGALPLGLLHRQARVVTYIMQQRIQPVLTIARPGVAKDV